jgi:hypothetical protein
MKSHLLLAAISGVVLGASGVVRAEEASSTELAFDDARVGQPLDADAGAKHACKGKNDCKGQGGCKTDKHACKGQNDCKGQGGCRTDGKKPQTTQTERPS